METKSSEVSRVRSDSQIFSANTSVDTNIIIELTPIEAEVIADYIFSKYTRLEDLGLHDSKCCVAMTNVWHKIQRAKNTNK